MQAAPPFPASLFHLEGEKQGGMEDETRFRLPVPSNAPGTHHAPFQAQSESDRDARRTLDRERTDRGRGERADGGG